MDHAHNAWLCRAIEFATGASRPPRERGTATAPWLTVQRFGVASIAAESAVLELLGELGPGVTAPIDPLLLLQRRKTQTSHPMFAYAVRRSESGLLLRACCAVPLEVVECREVQFELVAAGRPALPLPSPSFPTSRDVAVVEVRNGRAAPRRVRRHLMSIGVALAISAAPSVIPTLAAAAVTHGHVGATAKHHHTAPAAKLPAARHHHHLDTSGKRSSESRRPGSKPNTKHPTTARPHQVTVITVTTPAPTNESDCAHLRKPSDDGSATSEHPVTLPKCAPKPSKRHHRRHHTARHDETPPKAHRRHRKVEAPTAAVHPTKPAPAKPHQAANTDETAPAVTQPATSHQSASDSGVNVNPVTASDLAKLSSLVANPDQPPSFLIPIYKAAGRQYDIPWQILAAINGIETDYGRDLAVSPMGAIGWMQFMPATWMQYGVAGDGTDHRPNPYDPRDAIFSAARYLAANGGRDDIRKALFAYNDALWYVDAVLWRALQITDRLTMGRMASTGYALPLDAVYMSQLGRTDDGVDIEDAPDGAAVYSMTPGIVTAVASDPSGFGPNYPVIMVTAGPLAGQYIYYGHVEASLVHVGQHVLVGQPIAVMGHTGDAASLGHGHIEIGFSDGSGDPLDHHGATAWTSSGDAMRHVLVALAADFGIKTS
jgi:murein DD-endopeptidase MepM/ murein hydrolase activator NlpD